MGNSNGKGNNDTGLMDAAGGLALIPFFLAATMIFVIGVAIAFIWVPIVLIIVWAILKALWNVGILQAIGRGIVWALRTAISTAWHAILSVPETAQRRRAASAERQQRLARERATVAFYESAGIPDPLKERRSETSA